MLQIEGTADKQHSHIGILARLVQQRLQDDPALGVSPGDEANRVDLIEHQHATPAARDPRKYHGRRGG